LIIGNGAYKEGPLKNPVNDATDMAATLKGLGFQVILRTNAGRRQMVDEPKTGGGVLVKLFFVIKLLLVLILLNNSSNCGER